MAIIDPKILGELRVRSPMVMLGLELKISG